MHSGAKADAAVVDIAVLEAIDAARRNDDTSVAAVAEQLGIDRSGASRMITRAMDHGLLEKFAADVDQRRVQLDITAAGRALLREARAWQTATFRELVADWAPEDANRFATYLVRLADQVLTKEQL
jgi:DNA-binding MarR family transcriptional regulator